MKCCGCEKHIDIKRDEVVDDHASWYGLWNGLELQRVICYDCILIPEKKVEYVKIGD